MRVQNLNLKYWRGCIIVLNCWQEQTDRYKWKVCLQFYNSDSWNVLTLRLTQRLKTICTWYERQLTVWMNIGVSCHRLAYWHHCLLFLTVLACMEQRCETSGQAVNLIGSYHSDYKTKIEKKSFDQKSGAFVINTWRLVQHVRSKRIIFG